MSSKKTSSISFRIDEEYERVLRKVADKNKTSPTGRLIEWPTMESALPCAERKIIDLTKTNRQLSHEVELWRRKCTVVQ